MYLFCVEKIPSIIFKYVTQDEMDDIRRQHENRYEAIICAIPGTRCFHQFVPLSENKIAAKRYSNDEHFTCIHNFNKYHFEAENVNLG